MVRKLKGPQAFSPVSLMDYVIVFQDLRSPNLYLDRSVRTEFINRRRPRAFVRFGDQQSLHQNVERHATLSPFRIVDSTLAAASPEIINKGINREGFTNAEEPESGSTKGALTVIVSKYLHQSPLRTRLDPIIYLHGESVIILLCGKIQ